jgi:hypothetical protein
MKTKLLYLFILSALFIGCGTRPSTPPTFVLAYTGTDNRVHMLQSKDGATWVLPAVAPGPMSTDGVSAAHDGNLTWMVVWNGGGTLRYITGVGGLPTATSATGITWESTSNTITTSVVGGTPAVAFGNGKWVAVFASAGALKVVPSVLQGSTTSASDVDLGFSTSFTPALTFGAGKFVLAYLDGSQTLVARTSTDGVTWTAPTTVFARVDPGPPGDSQRVCFSPTAATLSFGEGAFYAVSRQSGTLCDGGTQAGGSTIVAYRSTDGVTWNTIIDRQGGQLLSAKKQASPVPHSHSASLCLPTRKPGTAHRRSAYLTNCWRKPRRQRPLAQTRAPLHSALRLLRQRRRPQSSIRSPLSHLDLKRSPSLIRRGSY